MDPGWARACCLFAIQRTFILNTSSKTMSHQRCATSKDVGSVVVRVLGGHDAPVARATWRPDGARLATGSRDGTARIWDAASGKTLRVLLRHRGSVSTPAWSPDGAYLATGSADGTARIWHAGSGRSIHVLSGHKGSVGWPAWSPDGTRLATGSDDGTARIWETASGKAMHVLADHKGWVGSPTWSSDGTRVATGSRDGKARIWDASSGKAIHQLLGHSGWAYAPTWSQKRNYVATGSHDGTARVWDAGSGNVVTVLSGHKGWVGSPSWSPDGTRVATGSRDGTARIWDAASGQAMHVLTGHKGWVGSPSWSPDGTCVATGSRDGTARIWDTASGKAIHVLTGHTDWVYAPTWHPEGGQVATASHDGTARIWDLGLGREHVDPNRITCRVAKIVLVGHERVGKTGLTRALAGMPFQETGPTHGRDVRLFDDRICEQLATLAPNDEQREAWVWDLAGQAGYRIFHQQHLDDAALGIVVFNNQAGEDPFPEVAYWARALDAANPGPHFRKLLVSSLADINAPPINKADLDRALDEFGFQEFLSVSAKEPYRADTLPALARRVRDAIAWHELPNWIRDGVLLQAEEFLASKRDGGLILVKEATLRDEFASKHGAPSEGAVRQALSVLEHSGLARRLRFRDWVLLRAEVLDAYGAWIASAAQDTSRDGAGTILERSVNDAKIPMAADRPLKGTDAEDVLLRATVNDLLDRGVALRQETEGGDMLVFPAEFSRHLPAEAPALEPAVAFTFQGDKASIHATLAVRLANVPIYRTPSPRFYHSAALFQAPDGATCGFRVGEADPRDQSSCRLTVMFSKAVRSQTKAAFLRYVRHHLDSRTGQEPAAAERIYEHCDERISPRVVAKIRRRGRNTVRCQICEATLCLDDLAGDIGPLDTKGAAQWRASGEEQARQARKTLAPERMAAEEFDLFLCHNSADKSQVQDIQRRLFDHGIVSWLDKEQILKGRQFIPILEQAIDRTPNVAVVVGPEGLGRWQEQEYYAFLQLYVEGRDDTDKKRVRIFPILLPGVERKPHLPTFLKAFHWVDLRRKGVDGDAEIGEFARAILQTNSPDDPDRL